MPSRDAIAMKIAKGRIKIRAAWFDSYQIVRTITTDDEGGGQSETTQVIEAGICALTAATARERVQAERLGWDASMTVRLRHDTLLTPADDLTINGRHFEVVGVVRGGVFAASATAYCVETG